RPWSRARARAAPKSPPREPIQTFGLRPGPGEGKGRPRSDLEGGGGYLPTPQNEPLCTSIAHSRGALGYTATPPRSPQIQQRPGHPPMARSIVVCGMASVRIGKIVGGREAISRHVVSYLSG